MPMKPAIAAAAAIAAGLVLVTTAKAQDTAEAILAGGCFWCVEADMDKVARMSGTVSGYIGGWTEIPTYQSHSSDGHYEAVLVTYDLSVTSYRELLDIFCPAPEHAQGSPPEPLAEWTWGSGLGQAALVGIGK